MYFNGFDILQAQNMDPLTHHSQISIAPRPLLRNLFQNERFRKMYLAHIRTIVNENFVNQDYFNRAQYLQTLIDVSVQNDTNKFYSYFDFANKRLFPDQVVRNGTKSCIVGYDTPGIKLMREIEKSVTQFIEKEKFFPKLILLKNHGIITVSASAKDCVTSALMCEKSAEIFIGAKTLNNMTTLTSEQIQEVSSDPNEKYRMQLLQ